MAFKSPGQIFGTTAASFPARGFISYNFIYIYKSVPAVVVVVVVVDRFYHHDTASAGRRNRDSRSMLRLGKN